MNTSKHILLLIALFIGINKAAAQDIKALKKNHTQIVDDGISTKSPSQYTFTHPDKWVLTENGKSGKDLKFIGGDKPVASQRQPQEIMLIHSHDKLGDVIVEFDFLQRGRDFSLRDVCVIYGHINDSTYCYAQAASEEGRYSHNIFKLADGKTQKIGKAIAPPVVWKYQKWHHITVIRDLSNHSVQMFVDETLVLSTDTDEDFVGKIGIGTYGSEFKIDNLQVWSK
jgi:hypothetical protein